MAVDQLQQSGAFRPAESAGRSNEPNDTGSNAEGRRRTLLFAAIVGCVILVGAASFWLYSRTYETTDDAQVDGHLNGITARIDGDVKAVHVEENQSVQAGDVLVELDPRDYEVAVEQARAQLLKAQAGERAGWLRRCRPAGANDRRVDELGPLASHATSCPSPPAGAAACG